MNRLKVMENNGHGNVGSAFKVGGFAWGIKDMQLLDDFIPAKGKHGLWGMDKERMNKNWTNTFSPGH
ncbi:hypothetical protein ACQKNS_15690 [Peribacillus sp. NPDC094092]|uniref:hypothetical protein n=1 Tax=Peribacillus sp. NPDC094092 TaxID=3390611 RepID=UPI003D02C7E2